MTAPRERHDITDHREAPARIDPTEANDPTLKAEPKEPIEPIDSTEPTDPTDRIEPFDPIDRIEPSERHDHIEVFVPTAPSCPGSSRRREFPRAEGGYAQLDPLPARPGGTSP
jgi:hypothetical protein